MTFGDGRYLHEILDNIALAMEAGVVDTFLWPQQLFADRESFDSFIEELSGYDQCFRITDQWYEGLQRIVGQGDEEGFVSSSEMAEEIFKEAAEHDKLDNFGRKTPRFKYTPEQCKAASLLDAKDGSSNFKLLTQAERNANRVISSFGSYYKLDISKSEYEQAKKEGKAFVNPVKKTPAKKAAKK